MRRFVSKLHELGTSGRRDGRDRGFILVVVISAIGLLALVAASFGQIGRSHVRVVATAIESAAAEAFADAGVQLAILDLVAPLHDPLHQRRFPANGMLQGCEAGPGNRILVSVRAEAGKVDLNSADEETLRALLAGLGFEGARSLADAILDYRDADNDRRQQGAEQRDYEIAGRLRGPKNAPFVAIDELEQVLGLTAVHVTRIRPHVTVYSGLASVNPAAATAELMAILSRGRTASMSTPESRSVDSDASVAGPIAGLAHASAGRYFSVRSEARTDRAVFVREAILEIGQSRPRTFTVLRWYRGTAASADPSSRLQLPEDVPECQ